MNKSDKKELSRLLNINTTTNSKDLVKLCKLMVNHKKDKEEPLIDVLRETIDIKKSNDTLK
jgi:hypothetical protein